MTPAQLFALAGAEREAAQAQPQPSSGENGYATLADALEMASMRFG